MFKIITDPEVYPLRSIDLSGALSEIAAVPKITSLGNTDIGFPRPDGATNLAFRAFRPAVSVEMILADSEAVRRLRELAGLSRANRQRARVLLAAGLDENTVLYAPLSRSFRYWLRNISNANFEIADPSQKILAANRYALDEDGFLSAVAADVGRFEPNGIARGARLEWNFKNLFSPSHPTAGFPLWTAGAKAPAVAFDSSIESVVRGKTGATRVTTSDPSGPNQWYISAALSGAAQAGYLYFGEWVRGRANFQIGLQEGALSISWSNPVALDPDRWTYVFHKLLTVGSSASFAVLNSADAGGANFEIYQGPGYLFQTPALDLAVRNPQQWNEFSIDTPEVVDLGPFRFPRDHTLVVAGTVPEDVTAKSRLLDLSGGSGGSSGISWNTQQIFCEIEGVAQTNPGLSLADHGANKGRPFVFISRLDSLAGTWKARLAIYREDRTILSSETTTDLASTVAPNAEDINTIRLGGAVSSSVPRPGSNLIGPIRLDRRAWSDAETDKFVKFSLDEAWTNFRFVTEGKLYHVLDLVVEQIKDRWRDSRVTMTLEEVDTAGDGDLSFAI